MFRRKNSFRHPRPACLRIEVLEPRVTMSASPLTAVAVQHAAVSGPVAAVAHPAGNLAALHNSQSVAFTETPLLTDSQDGNLVNAWGIARTRAGQFWVAENGNGTAELLDAQGSVLTTIMIPSPSDPASPGTPTGIVLNAGNKFAIGRHQPSQVIVATEDGTIAAWGPAVGNTAVIKVDDSATGAVYKGLADGNAHGRDFLYATDFHNGHIDMFDSNFRLAGSFFDPSLPPPPLGTPGFAPFGIRNIDGLLYVTYAMQNDEQHDDVAGAGLGFVDVFRTDGRFVRRLVSNGPLNSPWGLALAPEHLGQLRNVLLVGNFGDGTINAFNLRTGASLGPLTDSTGAPIVVDGLWGLEFGSSGDDTHRRGAHNTDLFFAAGPNGEANGLFGVLTPSVV